MSTSENLRKAKENKNNEFYTQLADIEEELKHYKEHFKWKTIFCNCDDPFESNFFKYFAMRFNSLWLKKLIVTGYSTSPIAFTQLPLFEIAGFEWQKNKTYKIEINEVYDANKDWAINLADVEYLLRTWKWKNKLTLLKEDWDFRSKESIELLKQSDIVVTNPPFSLFREYIAQLIKYKKKFLIIWNKNAIAYKEVFPLLNKNKIWIGYTSPKAFILPWWIISKKQNWLTRWFTNLKIPKQNDILPLYKKYTEDEYIKYDNFDWIDIWKVADIPMDYEGAMWVPITFIDSFNSSQFEILWAWTWNTAKKIWITKNYRGRTDLAITKNWVHSCPYNRIIIRHKK